MVGQTISHYPPKAPVRRLFGGDQPLADKILEKLGEGGMGVVYKAHVTKLDRDVAIKFLSASHAVTEQDKTRFIHESRAVSPLDWPNIGNI